MRKRLKRSYTPILLFLLLLASLTAMVFLLEYGIVGVETSTEAQRIQRVPDAVKVHFIDVGQGDAILIQIHDKHLLIDAGPAERSQTVIDYLRKHNVQRLDMVFLTHPHEDHVGGMGDVLRSFPVGAFYSPDKDTVTRSYERMLHALKDKNLPIETLRGGMEFVFEDNIILSILSPNQESYLNPNNYSPLMHLRYGTTAFLFTGDAEEPVEQEVLRLGRNVEANVLKSPHHGSSTSSTEPFLQKVGAELAVVTSGQGNPFGLPSPEILERYALHGMQVLMTESLGTIVLSSNGREVRILSN